MKQGGEAAGSVLRSELHSLTRGAGLTGLWSVAGYGVGLLATVAVTRLVGVEVFGIVAVSISAVGVLQVFATMGMDRGVLKYVSSFFGTGDFRRLDRTVRYARNTTLALSGVIVGAYLLFVHARVEALFPRVVGIQSVLTAFVLFTPIAGLSLIHGNGLVALQAPQHDRFANGLIKPGGQIVFLIPLLLLPASDLTALTAATLLGYLGAFAYSAWAFRRVLRKRRPPGPAGAEPELPVGRPSDARGTPFQEPATAAAPQSGGFHYGTFLSFSLPLALIPVLNLASQRLDVLLVGHFLGADETGVYAVVRKLADVTALPLLAAGGIGAATASKLYAVRAMDELRFVYIFVTRWLFMFSAVIFAIFMAVPTHVLAVFGEEFRAGANALRILAVGQLANVAVGPSGNTLLVVGKERLVLLNSLVSATSGLGLAFLLIPTLGVVGAAIALAVTITLVNGLSAVQLWWTRRIVPGTIGEGVRRTIGLGIGLSVTYAIARIGLPSLVTLPLCVVGAVVAVGGLSVLLEGLDEEERALLGAFRQKLGLTGRRGIDSVHEEKTAP